MNCRQLARNHRTTQNSILNYFIQANREVPDPSAPLSAADIAFVERCVKDGIDPETPDSQTTKGGAAPAPTPKVQEPRPRVEPDSQTESRKNPASPTSTGKVAVSTEFNDISDRILTWREIADELKHERTGWSSHLIGKTPHSAKAAICIAGVRGVGKSAYLYVLSAVHQRGRLGCWRFGDRSVEYKKLVSLIDSKVRQGIDWKTTFKTELLEPIHLFNVFRGKPLLREQIAVETFDLSGELWKLAFDEALSADLSSTEPNDRININRLRRYVARCKGFLILLDPADKKDYLGNVRRYLEFLEALALLDSGSSGNAIRRPVALILNKIDQFPEDYERLIGKPPLIRQTIARDLLKKHFKDVYAQLDSGLGRLKTVETFAISCWGEKAANNENPNAVRYESIEPLSAEEPLEWIVNQVCHRHRTDKLTRRAFKLVAITICLLILVMAAFHLSIAGTSLLARWGMPQAAEGLMPIAVHNPLRNPKGLDQAWAAIAESYIARGQGRLAAGNFVESIADFDHAIQISRQLGAQEAEGLRIATAKLASAYFKKGQHGIETDDAAGALEDLRAALALTDITSRTPMIASFLKSAISHIEVLLASKKSDNSYSMIRTFLGGLVKIGADAANTQTFHTQLGSSISNHARDLVKSGGPRQALTFLHTLPRDLIEVIGQAQVKACEEEILQLAMTIAIDGGNFDEADGLFQEYSGDVDKTKLVHNLIPHYLRLAEAKIASQDEVGAAEILRRAEAIAGGQDLEPIGNKRARLAAMLVDKGNFEEADGLFAVALAHGNRSIVTSLAAESYRNALVKAKQSSEMTRVNQLITLKNKWEKVLSGVGEEWEEHLRYARELLAQGLLDSAVEQYRIASSGMEPKKFNTAAINDFAAEAQKALTQENLEQTGKILSAADKVVHDVDGGALCQAACSYAVKLLGKGQLDQAKHQFIRLTINASTLTQVLVTKAAVPAYLDAARKQINSSQLDKADELLSDVSGFGDNNTQKGKIQEGRCDLAVALSQQKRLPDALRQFRLARQIKGDYAVADAAVTLILKSNENTLKSPAEYGAVLDMAQEFADAKWAPQLLTKRTELARDLLARHNLQGALRHLLLAMNLPGVEKEARMQAVQILEEAALNNANQADKSFTDQVANELHQFKLSDSEMRLVRCRIALNQGLVGQAEQDLKGANNGPDRDFLEKYISKVKPMCFIPAEAGEHSEPGFYIDRTEVTVTQFEQFLQATGRIPAWQARFSQDKEKWLQPDNPAVNITWDEARAFGAYIGKRLPNEREWARAVGNGNYPWGTQYRAGYSNLLDDKRYTLLPVTSDQIRMDRSPYGVLGLAGNAAEWTATPGTWEKDGKSLSGLLIKGGSWLTDAANAKKDTRRTLAPNTYAYSVGFRCTCDLLSGD